MTNGDQQGTWVNLKSGGSVLRLWEIAGALPGDPHVAILRLSDARYKEFKKDRKKFLIDNNIFYTKELNKVEVGPELTPTSDNPGTDWMVTAEHDWSTCNSMLVAMLLFKPKPKESY